MQSRNKWKGAQSGGLLGFGVANDVGFRLARENEDDDTTKLAAGQAGYNEGRVFARMAMAVIEMLAPIGDDQREACIDTTIDGDKNKQGWQVGSRETIEGRRWLAKSVESTVVS